jgi:DNA-binding LacI/PurR family transcriptional regulator
MLLQRQVDGLLIVPAGTGEATVHLCREHGVPLVVVDRRPKAPGVDVVRADSEGGAEELGRLLVSLGHRRVAVLSGPASVPTAVDRVAGFYRALVDEAGLPPPQVRYGAFSIESGHAMALSVVQASPRPTALFAANNFIAIGVLHALEELSLRVPDDVAVVGFDDLPRAMVTFPFLTVAAQPALEMASRRRRAPRSPGEPDWPARDVVLPTELVIRRSSGGPPRRHLADDRSQRPRTPDPGLDGVQDESP